MEAQAPQRYQAANTVLKRYITSSCHLVHCAHGAPAALPLESTHLLLGDWRLCCATIAVDGGWLPTGITSGCGLAAVVAVLRDSGAEQMRERQRQRHRQRHHTSLLHAPHACTAKSLSRPAPDHEPLYSRTRSESLLMVLRRIKTQD